MMSSTVPDWGWTVFGLFMVALLLAMVVAAIGGLVVGLWHRRKHGRI